MTRLIALASMAAYLLPHQQTRYGEPDHVLVSAQLLEAMAGLTFFRDRFQVHGEDAITGWKVEDWWTRWSLCRAIE